MAVIQATGRRKTTTAKIFLRLGKGKIHINKRNLTQYFPRKEDQQCVETPLRLTNRITQYDINVQVTGGGTTGQKEAIRHGISRALCLADPKCRPVLKKNRLLARDPRKVERKKYGQPKARKKSPFRKR